MFDIPKLGAKFKQDVLPLTYTPRKFVLQPSSNLFYMIESDHRSWSPESTEKKFDELVSLWPSLSITRRADQFLIPFRALGSLRREV
jgi:hypothetical protein